MGRAARIIISRKMSAPTGPVCCLFKDAVTTRRGESVQDLADRLSALACSRFKETYGLDLECLAPCSNQSWTWEAVDGQTVPKLYRRKTYPLVPSGGDNCPPPTPHKKTPVSKELSPTVKEYFRKVRRSSSLEISPKGKESPTARSKSLGRRSAKGGQQTLDGVVTRSKRKEETEQVSLV